MSRLSEIETALTQGSPEKYETELWSRASSDTSDVVCLVLLGRCLLAQGKLNQALNSYKLAAAVSPTNSPVRDEYGRALASCGFYLASLKCHERAVVLDPNNINAIFARGQAYQRLCLIDKALVDYNTVITKHPDLQEAIGFRLVAMNYITDDQAALFAESVRYGTLLGGAVNKPTGSPNPKIRVGILSPDLHVHSVTYFIRPLILLMPDQFELYTYYDNAHADAATAEIEAKAAVSRRVMGLSNEALEARMLSDQLDVVIDLAGHFGRHRLPVFAHRVAPVQVSYLGYPNTTGVSAMDFRISDQEADWSCDNDFTERFVALKTMWAYQPSESAPAVSPAPTVSAFGYFGMLTKITPEVGRIWAALTNSTGARLIIKGDGLDDPGLKAEWLERLLSWGFSYGLVELRGKTTTAAAHLGSYAEVTVALDTWPYGGTTTTCEALWMGVPVVTLKGKRHASRVGASLLLGANLGGWIAKDTDDYIEIARQCLITGTRVARSDICNATWMQHARVAADFWDAIRVVEGLGPRP